MRYARDKERITHPYWNGQKRPRILSVFLHTVVKLPNPEP